MDARGRWLPFARSEPRHAETRVAARRFATNDMDPIELGLDRTVVSSWPPDDTWPAGLEDYGEDDSDELDEPEAR